MSPQSDPFTAESRFGCALKFQCKIYVRMRLRLPRLQPAPRHYSLDAAANHPQPKNSDARRSSTQPFASSSPSISVKRADRRRAAAPAANRPPPASPTTPRLPANASSSSKKMMAGAAARALENAFRNTASPSPRKALYSWLPASACSQRGCC